MEWKAIYSGISFEDAMRTDGLMGFDVLWASVVLFPDSETMKVAISSYADVARSIGDIVRGKKREAGNEVYTCGFRCTLEEVIGMVEQELGKELDRYEGDLEGAQKEAAERMKRGHFDGGVALMGRVAVWDQTVDSWGVWNDRKGKEVDKWGSEMRKVVNEVRNEPIGGDGCEC
ncbi:hypothetical protein ONS95_009985 [Cadophora gregata]|uniref:uncharacterized protein n=1 Tax=Cadophora gregata TaxID=51156 RepID=UPI0026DC36D0|nr:uncharacterized protein ONS95_009985 [Cadophora gregata]KAK0121700.1 hypothetical protein ONS95_009985 [Cadophora gregata]KAK0127177.1 hypothetical protein ONS96_006729 [Cadophora gregata f. sp. sojae]